MNVSSRFHSPDSFRILLQKEQIGSSPSNVLTWRWSSRSCPESRANQSAMATTTAPRIVVVAASVAIDLGCFHSTTRNTTRTSGMATANAKAGHLPEYHAAKITGMT